MRNCEEQCGCYAHGFSTILCNNSRPKNILTELCKFKLFFPPKYTKYNSAISTSLMSLLLLYPETPWNGCSQFNSHSSHVFISFDFKKKPNTCVHGVVIIVIIVIIAGLTLCYSIMSHATLYLFFSCIPVKIVNLLNIACTLVATSVVLQSLEYSLLVWVTIYVLLQLLIEMIKLCT